MELENAQLRVTSYQLTADQLLDVGDPSDDSRNIRSLLNSVTSKLTTLLDTCSDCVTRSERPGSVANLQVNSAST